MPNPQEVAIIVAGGGIYSHWKSIEIERTAGTGVSYMKFSCAEPGGKAGALGWNNLQLMPGDAATGLLGGALAITGNVVTRQARYDAKNHGVEIIIASYTQDVIASTVDGSPGQYKNQTFQQICSAVGGKVNVNVLVDAAPGTDKIFERVSEHIGETRFQFLERLGRMRNLHPCDDENGNLRFIRAQSTTPVASLVEGQNILRAGIVLNQQYAVTAVKIVGQNFGNDTHNGPDAAQVTATTPNSAYTGRFRPMTILMEQPGDKQDAQMRSNHEIDLNALEICEVKITVPGWFMDDGTLWIAHVQEAMPISINSPMLIPQNPFTLLLRGAKHMQDDENGTRTELDLCIQRGLGANAQPNLGNGSIAGLT